MFTCDSSKSDEVDEDVAIGETSRSAIEGGLDGSRCAHQGLVHVDIVQSDDTPL